MDSPFRSAAFRNKLTGEIVESGSLHDVAVLPEDDDLAKYEDGFVDHSGIFYDRDGAKALIEELKKSEEEITLSKALKDYKFKDPTELESYITPNKPGRVLLFTAHHNGKEIGTLSISKHPNATANHPHNGYHTIGAAHVHALHRGNGVYGRLLHTAALYVKKHFKSKGLVSPGQWRSEKADGAWQRMAAKNKATERRGYGDPDASDFFMSEKDEQTEQKYLQHEFEVEFRRWFEARTNGKPYVPHESFDLTKAEAALHELIARHGNLKDEPSLDHHEVARQMIGYDPESSPEFVAARFLAGGDFAPEESLRAALILYDNDFELAALRAYGLPRNEKYRDMLRSAVAMLRHLSGSPIEKSEIEPAVIPRDIRAATPEGEKTAQAVRRAQAAGKIHAVQLDPNAKHSKGTAIATDPDTNEKWLLKPGSGKLSPSAGVRDETADQSQREVAFSKCVDAMGIGNFFPEADLLMIDGQRVAVMRLLGTEYKGMEKLRQGDDTFRPDVFFREYFDSGALYKWALVDWIFGNPDRHANNLMVNEDRSDVKLIDHGSAFAGVHFDPAHDPKSFTPFYLRAWAGDQNWSSLDATEREDEIPRMNIEKSEEFGNWIETINEAEIVQILQRYGIKPDAVIARLHQLKATPPEERGDMLMALWAGALS